MQQQMKIAMTEESGGNKFDVSTSLGDMVALEEQFDIAVSDLRERQKMGWMVFLAWHAAKRTKKTVLGLQEFTDAVDTIDVSEVDEVDEGKDVGVPRHTGSPVSPSKPPLAQPIS